MLNFKVNDTLNVPMLYQYTYQQLLALREAI